VEAGTQGRTWLAPAKINLALHVTGRRDDGYHLLDSLAVFARFGDRLEIEPAGEDTFTISGRYADGLPLYRQEGILRRQGVEISRSTM